MPTLLLHIGTHKTGTTAIQSFLEANAAALEKNGLLFPIFETRWPQRVFPNRNGYFLNRAALHYLGAETDAEDRRRAVECVTRLAERVKGRADAVVLLSDERLWFSGALHEKYWDAVKLLAESMGFDRVRVFVYLRRQDRFAEALWNQFVKSTKKTETLAEYLGTMRVRMICDYYAGVKRLERVFGKDNLHVAVYDRATLKNGDAVDDFRDRVGLPPDLEYARPQRPESNPRLNNNLAELKRIVNLSREYGKLGNVFGAAFAHAMETDGWSSPTEMLDDEARSAFLYAFKPGNKRLAREYFGENRLFPPPRPNEFATWRFNAEDMLRDAVLVMADQLARQELRLNALNERLARLEASRERGG